MPINAGVAEATVNLVINTVINTGLKGAGEAVINQAADVTKLGLSVATALVSAVATVAIVQGGKLAFRGAVAGTKLAASGAQYAGGKLIDGAIVGGGAVVQGTAYAAEQTAHAVSSLLFTAPSAEQSQKTTVPAIENRKPGVKP